MWIMKEGGIIKDVVNGLGRSKEENVQDVKEAFVNLVAFHHPSEYDADLYPLDSLPF